MDQKLLHMLGVGNGAPSRGAIWGQDFHVYSWAEGFTFETLSFLASNNYYSHKNSALYRKLKNLKSQI